MDDALLDVVLGRLDRHGPPPAATDLIVAACDSAANLDRALGDTSSPATPKSDPSPTQTEPVGAYLSAIDVAGFRGIGPSTKLSIPPGPGLTVVIGAEHAAPDLRSFSLIASTAVDGDATRTVGVIGPTRMHYSRTITLVDGATQAVSRVLRDAN